MRNIIVMLVVFGMLPIIFICPVIGQHVNKNSYKDDDGLVAYYPFDGDAIDVSGYGNHGAVYGAILTSDRFDIPNSAYYFGGNGENIACGNGETLQISGDITVCAWVKLISGGVIVNKYLLNVDRGWLIEIYPGGAVAFNVRSGVGELNSSGGNFNVLDDQWHFVVGQRSGRILKIYIDGGLNSQKDSYTSADMSNSAAMYIGVQSDRPTDPAAFTKGVIDEVRVYNRALTDSEIRDIYYEYLPKLTQIVVNPSVDTLQVQEQTQFNAMAYDQCGYEMSFTPIWSVSGGSINNEGLYTATIIGDFIVTAAVEGDTITGNASVHVNPAELAQIIVIPGKAELVAGQQQQFNAIGYDAYGNVVFISPIWSTTGGSISSTGLYTASQAGNFTVTASVEGNSANGTASVSVNAANLTNIIVSPKDVTLAFGKQQQFTATGYDAYGNEVSISPLWTTTGGSITNDGLYTATQEGNFIVTASISTIKDDATVHVTDALVAYYRFSGDAVDESGYGNHGTVNGATLIKDRFGSDDHAYHFNGNGNSIYCDNSSSFQISSDITVCAWVKLQPTSHGQVIINKYLLSVDKGWLIETYPDGIVAFNVRSEVGELNSSGGNFNIFDDQWHFVVGQRNGTLLKIYIDGGLNSQQNSFTDADMSNSADLMIGVQSDRPNDPLAFCKGVIDDIRVYSRALTDSEIKGLYDFSYQLKK